MDRILHEYNKIKRFPIEGIEVELSEWDYFSWNGILIGPPGTPFQGGKFHFELIFPQDFPNSPPDFFFRTPIFHPNVDSNGKACTQILNLTWNPKVSVSYVINSIFVLLNEPYPDAGYINDAYTVIRADRQAYERTARQYTANYAK